MNNEYKMLYNDNLLDFLLNRSLITSIVYQNLDLASFKSGVFNTKYILSLKKYFQESENQKLYSLLFVSFFLCIEAAKTLNDTKSKLGNEIHSIIAKGRRADKDGTWISRGIYLFLIHFRCFYDFYVLHKAANIGNVKIDEKYFEEEFGFMLKIGEIYENKLAFMGIALQKVESSNIDFYSSIIDDPEVFKQFILDDCGQQIYSFAKKIPPMGIGEEKFNVFEWRKALNECMDLLHKAHEDKVKNGEDGETKTTESVINKTEILFPNLLCIFKEKALSQNKQTKEKYANLKDNINHLNYRDFLYLIPYFISKEAFSNFTKEKSTNENFCYMIYVRSALSFADNRSQRDNSMGLISNFMSALIMEMLLRYTNKTTILQEYRKNSLFADFFGFYFENNFSEKIKKNNEVFENIAKTNFKFRNVLPINIDKYPAFVYQRLTTDYLLLCLENAEEPIKNDLKKLNNWLKQYAETGEMPTAMERQENLIERIYSALKPLYFPINFNYYDTPRQPKENLMRLDVRDYNNKNKENDLFFRDCNAEILNKLVKIILPMLQNREILK